jgi:hypothetical protein
MSLSTRLDKLEAAMRGRDGDGPPDEPWICRLIYDQGSTRRCGRC